MRVLIVESSYPKDFFAERLDGVVTHHLTKLLRIDSRLVYALDKRHFEKAVDIAATENFDVLHLSCHGDKDGIALSDNTDIDWPILAKTFKERQYQPTALVMSTCCGAIDELGEAFEGQTMRPNIIFGSTDERSYNEYAIAWTILYDRFKSFGVHRDIAQEALREIGAVAHRNFRYLRWDGKRRYYRSYPRRGTRHRIVEV